MKTFLKCAKLEEHFCMDVWKKLWLNNPLSSVARTGKDCLLVGGVKSRWSMWIGTGKPSRLESFVLTLSGGIMHKQIHIPVRKLCMTTMHCCAAWLPWRHAHRLRNEKRVCRCQEHHRVAFEVFKLKSMQSEKQPFCARFCKACRANRCTTGPTQEKAGETLRFRSFTSLTDLYGLNKY